MTVDVRFPDADAAIRAAAVEFWGRTDVGELLYDPAGELATTIREHVGPVIEALQARVRELETTWRCFYCGFETQDRSEAMAHFGDEDDVEPLCMAWAQMTATERVSEYQGAIYELNAEREANAVLCKRIEGIESNTDLMERERDEWKRRAETAEAEVALMRQRRDEYIAASNRDLEARRTAEERVRDLESALRRVRQGYRNILELRKLTSGRYGALTREEVEQVISEVDAVLDATRQKGGSA